MPCSRWCAIEPWVAPCGPTGRSERKVKPATRTSAVPKRAPRIGEVRSNPQYTEREVFRSQRASVSGSDRSPSFSLELKPRDSYLFGTETEGVAGMVSHLKVQPLSL